VRRTGATVVEAALSRDRRAPGRVIQASSRFARVAARALPTPVEGIQALRDRLMLALARARQLDWLCQHVGATVDLEQAQHDSRRALAKLRQPSLYSQRPGWVVSLRTGGDDLVHATTLLDLDERWAVLQTRVRLGTSVSLEYYAKTSRTLLCIRGDVMFADDQIALVVFDGPAITSS
jgi:hypothetical protein